METSRPPTPNSSVRQRGLSCPPTGIIRCPLSSEKTGELRTPKTPGSRRTVTITPTTSETLRRHLEEHPPGDRGLVFTSPEGSALRLANFRKRIWYPAVDASVGRPMTIHSLRHTHVALCIAQRLDPYTISRRLGHTNITTTLRVYGHLFDFDDTTATALEKLHSSDVS